MLPAVPQKHKEKDEDVEISGLTNEAADSSSDSEGTN